MSTKFLLTGVVLALSLTMAGCQQPMTPTPTAPGLGVVAPGQGSVTASMHLEITDVAGRRLLTMDSRVLPWVKANIDHVKLSLYDGANALVVSTSVSQADLDGMVSFSNLRMNTTYKVVAQAWADAGETQRIDAGATDESSCTTTFATTNVDRIYVDALKLKLANKTFSGKTTGSAIHVTDGIVEDTTATEAVTVVAPAPTLSSLSSTSGPLTGGNTVTLTGTNFTGATAVTFGGMYAISFTVVSATEIIAVAPPRILGGAVDVMVTTPSGSATAAGAYTYGSAPTILSVSPNNGPEFGGYVATVTGTGFTTATSVTIGGVPTSFTVVSDTQLVFTVPAYPSAGTVDVMVTNAGGGSATAVDAFTYVIGIPG